MMVFQFTNCEVVCNIWRTYSCCTARTSAVPLDILSNLHTAGGLFHTACFATANFTMTGDLTHLYCHHLAPESFERHGRYIVLVCSTALHGV